MSYDFDWVDAFTDQPMQGNGCAVVHGGAELAEAACMAFVAETSLTECTFTGPSEVADIRVRYFLASREIPFAGHPTVATVAAMRARGLIGDGPMTLETLAGVIPVDVEGMRVRMRQNAPEFGAMADPHLVAAAVGLEASDIVSPPRIVSTGLPFCITVVKDRDTIRKAALSQNGLAAYAAALGHGATDVMEPYLITRVGAPDGADTYARLLMAPPSPPEDPFTGSATGAAAGYLWENGLISTPDYVAAQGDDMGRSGRAKVRLIGTPEDIESIEVAGDGYVLMSGQLHL
jgi:PhzF family phenazine biosynthesis protein